MCCSWWLHSAFGLLLQGARLDTQRALADERVAKEMVQERCASIQQVRYTLLGSPDEPRLTLASKIWAPTAVGHDGRLLF